MRNINSSILGICGGMVVGLVVPGRMQADGVPAYGAAGMPREVGGIYPSLAMFNISDECGTGAVVPWAGRLWAITYAPHMPRGSDDKLYEITPEMKQIVRPESVGGTPAGRMIHLESKQLFLGSYAIDAAGKVRAIPFTEMLGRHTGIARHLLDPAGKVYVATMEEGFYEVDVKDLSVKALFLDSADKREGPRANLPGYHGKGLYSGQGRLVYANNGEQGNAAKQNPRTPSGALASWDGRSETWEVVRRNQFTEVTGPGGLEGNADPERDPVWTIGWDHRSLIFMCLDGGKWHTWRLPKGSHSYDGAHGWNTEWPRIREIGEGDNLLMTMHGTFWRFPRAFRAGASAGIAPRSNYLKVIADFARWGERVVFACDDTAKSEFLNRRKAKGIIAAPESQSNLWFVEPERIDRLGPVIGRGGVWVEDDVEAGAVSDPYLLDGYERKGLFLAHGGGGPAEVELEVDAAGDGAWKPARTLAVPAGRVAWIPVTEKGAWIRLRSVAAMERATAWFQYSNADTRGTEAPALFEGLAAPGETAVTGGVLRAAGDGSRTLLFAARRPSAGGGGTEAVGYYEMDAELRLAPVDKAGAFEQLEKDAAIPDPAGVLEADAASLIYIDDKGGRFRLPRGDEAFGLRGPLGHPRIAREVSTERDLFNAGGTFFELPAENAGGFPKVRPVATHNRRIHDYASYRGLFLISGMAADAPAGNARVIRSTDGKTALWAGAVDDLWQLGKPRGRGGPWKAAAVKAGEVSDPYLMTGYDRKRMTMEAKGETGLTAEIDVNGDGLWVAWERFELKGGKPVAFEFPEGFNAYWIRFTSRAAAEVTVELVYE